MPFQRQYTRDEVRGMLKIFEGNCALNGILNGRVQRSDAAAHAHIHGGSTFLEQRARVNTPGEPRKTGTYWNTDDQVDATTEILNSHQVQIQLRQLDIGEQRLGVEAALTHGKYRISKATDNSDLGGNPGHLGRKNPGRVNAGSTHVQGFAKKGFVLLIRQPGNLLQIQTSYPIM